MPERLRTSDGGPRIERHLEVAHRCPARYAWPRSCPEYFDHDLAELVVREPGDN